ncbi:BN860_01904g1_1 [Zygosaccharomyces bailii CLIB 213]|uniref:BN860_01904g1_1 n=1 Tax=Zygosaccharomyces bailii (strain CLIB 213 / ATCC 58445 / CBS 680 / BCRC 21525 / NBRC 1098 / NCYC 1416 / NRRL Y-2227) TaxID=1333698 RepID=A0A8J2X5S0_ZYGB2|nr:BN860_01904g1_1 [Zygosaccharomyces bailii CLIB 213]
MISIKQFFKWCSILATLITLSTNFYIYTYPSAYPAKCSWYCAEEGPEFDASSLSIFAQAIYYTKRYLKDVYEQNVIGVEPPKGSEDGGPEDVHIIAFGDPQIKGIWHGTDYNTRLDIYGNDYYLGHIVSVMQQRLKPSHVAVLGDLFSSQWIGDSEFYNRTSRYLTRLFHRDTSWIESVRDRQHDDNGLYKVQWMEWGQDLNKQCEAEKPWDLEFGYSDVHSWDHNKEDYLFINVTGNHDIGYSGDTTYQHLARYAQLFGKDNYWIEYDRDTDHPWRIVVLNSLLLEGPALQPEFLDITWEFLTQLAERNFEGSTVLLSHVPFYKEEGLCSDGPHFDYYPETYESEPYKSNLLRSQNHLSKEVSDEVLNLVFFNNKPGIILTGHDHEGCKTYYNKDFDTNTWTASKQPTSELAIQEITVRAMMGEFDGNTGILTGHFDRSTSDWHWHFKLCPFMVQHIWWVAKIFLIVTVLLWSITFFL